MSQSGSFSSGSTPPPANSIQTVTGNTGGAVGPDVGGNINLLGDGVVISVDGDPGSNSLDIVIATATTTNEGVVELATDAEAIAGTATDVVITPSNLTAKLGTQTDHGVAVGDTTTGALQWTAPGTNGQVLIGATGADPAFGAITSAGNTVLVTYPAPYQINLETNGSFTSSTIVTEFTSSGTWTKNANAKMVEIFMIGGGGGGGSGACGASGTVSGGQGGNITGVLQLSLQASAFGASETVTIGAGGMGGASVTAGSDTVGNNGTRGGLSSCGYLISAGINSFGAGGNGIGGQINADTGNLTSGNQSQGMLYNAFQASIANSQIPLTANTSGLRTGYSAYVPPAGGVSYCMGMSAGGGGGGANVSVAYRGASVVVGSTTGFVGTPAIGGVETGTIDGQDGAGRENSGGFTSWGTGGAGGGGQSVGTRGGNGGNAGGYGAGGGGGGASLTGSPSGAGGNGSPGYVRITEYL